MHRLHAKVIALANVIKTLALWGSCNSAQKTSQSCLFKHPHSTLCHSIFPLQWPPCTDVENVEWGVCTDNDQRCSDRASGGECQNNQGYMLTQCRQSCGGLLDYVCSPQCIKSSQDYFKGKCAPKCSVGATRNTVTGECGEHAAATAHLHVPLAALGAAFSRLTKHALEPRHSSGRSCTPAGGAAALQPMHN